MTKKLSSNATVSVENYTYDAAGNVTDAPDRCFEYDTNNRLISYNGNAVSYDLDGNMLSDGSVVYEYDSANRLIKAGGNEYTYNAEDVRIRNLCGEYDTTYVYDTVVKLSRMLMKTTNGIVTKYVYGLGLIGEEKECNVFKVYHFDYRGSTVAITDMYGNVTDTFEYDTYGKLVSRTGDSFVIFGYNGRDGVVTDKNGLLYMRARYYNPTLCRFVNADIIHGEISDSTSLNRYAYVNGNPVSFVDPFGLAKWWETALKIAAGVAVIATLAVVTVATAGTATAVIAGAAAVGATVSGAVNVASGIIAGESADEIASSFLAGTISGAASGALTASGAGAGLIATVDVAIDVGELYLEDFIDDGKVNDVGIEEVAWTVGIGAFTGIKGKITKKLDNGWLNKKGAFLQTQENYTKKITREGRRANRKAANIKIKDATNYYNSEYFELLASYAINSTKDEIMSSIDENLRKNIHKYVCKPFCEHVIQKETVSCRSK